MTNIIDLSERRAINTAKETAEQLSEAVFYDGAHFRQIWFSEASKIDDWFFPIQPKRTAWQRLVQSVRAFVNEWKHG